MPEALPEYELYAIRYAMRPAQRRDNFIGGDPHEAPMPMDYFVWAIVGPDRSVVIDVGFNAEVAKQRGRTHLRCPVEALRLVGVDPARVEDVIVTHLHYDHAGNFELFPRAQFHVQESEVHYATGRYMRYPRLAHGYEPDDVCQVVRLNFARRVCQYEGDWEFAPGIRVHHTGGHTAGLQFVSVHTARGWVVVASDASHFYENMETMRPFPTAFHVGEMYESFDRLRAVAPTQDHIVPGHDPLVMARYPAPSTDLQDIVVRLDVAPAK
jgi:glyoxylase-like metal-dependent hydrolase (beta-lactamase superfamily II)